MKVSVVRGHMYVGAADVPFFISNDLIKEKLQEAGFVNVRVFGREDFERHVPINPKGLPGYNDDWDTAFLGQSAVTKTLDIPTDLAWLYSQAPSSTTLKAVPLPPPGPALPIPTLASVTGRKPPSAGIAIAAVVLMGVGGVLLLSKTKKL